MMNQLPDIEQVITRRTCDCKPKCKEFYKINGFDVYCKKSLENLAFDILNKLNGTTIMQGNYTNNGWTTRMERELINYINTQGVQNGTYAKLGVMLGKSRQQVKNKVYQLEKQGRLSFKRVEIRKRASDIANNV